MIIRRDNAEQKYYSLFLLPKDNNPRYFENLIRNAKILYYGLNRKDLIQELDYMLKEMIEKPMGTSIQNVLLVHRNLPTMNSFTRSKNPLYNQENVYKYTIQKWLDDIEMWIFQKAIELEPQIRFSAQPKQYV